MKPSPADTTSRNLIIVFVEDHPKVIMLLRAAQKRAKEKGMKWRSVYIETPANNKTEDENARERMLKVLTLAEQMGAETEHLEAETIEKGLQILLDKEGARIALVMIGSAEVVSYFKPLHNTSSKRIANIAKPYTQIEIITLSGPSFRRGLVEKLYLHEVRARYFLYALFSVAVAFFGAYGLERLLSPELFRLNNQNVVPLFMISCAFAAGRFGWLPGLVASVASYFTVNYFFTQPYHVFKFYSVTDTMNMALFLSAALFISLFSSQTRDNAQRATRREVSTSALFTLYRVAANSFSREQALDKLQRKLTHMLEVDVAFFLPSPIDSKIVEIAYPVTLELTENDTKALNACWLEIKTTGAAAPFNPGTAWRFEPMIAPSGEMGVLGVRPFGKAKLDAWFSQLLTAIADQTASVMEHIALEHSMAENRINQEREKLRSMLLSSVSHDLKTPLAGIIGALSVHRSLGERLTAEKRDELIEAAIEEAQRLDSFITNILDMTRLESGNIQFKKEWHNVHSSLVDVARRLQQRCRKHQVVVHPAPAAIEAFMDVMMTEQVLQNLLDNACKYTQAGTIIEMSCRISEEQGVLCEIHDHGAGIPADKVELVFNKYTRLKKKDAQVAGTGLGLAISRTIMDGQGGWVTGANHPDGGAIFTICLPQWRLAQPKNTGMSGVDNASTG